MCFHAAASIVRDLVTACRWYRRLGVVAQWRVNTSWALRKIEFVDEVSRKGWQREGKDLRGAWSFETEQDPRLASIHTSSILYFMRIQFFNSNCVYKS